MTGPEHYLEAERLLDVAADFAEIHDQAIAIAQVHATLALAAATAMGARPAGPLENPRPGGMPRDDFLAWVCGVEVE